MYLLAVGPVHRFIPCLVYVVLYRYLSCRSRPFRSLDRQSGISAEIILRCVLQLIADDFAAWHSGIVLGCDLCLGQLVFIFPGCQFIVGHGLQITRERDLFIRIRAL